MSTKPSTFFSIPLLTFGDVGSVASGGGRGGGGVTCGVGTLLNIACTKTSGGGVSYYGNCLYTHYTLTFLIT